MSQTVHHPDRPGDRVHTPGNDRIPLGLEMKSERIGTESVATSSVEARREKARRGELIVVTTAGYEKTENYRLEKGFVVSYFFPLRRAA